MSKRRLPPRRANGRFRKRRATGAQLVPPPFIAGGGYVDEVGAVRVCCG